MSMTKHNRRRSAALLAVALVAVLCAGGTLAYLTYRTDPAANTFADTSDAKVSVLLTETGWDNTTVEWSSADSRYQMGSTEYTLFGVSSEAGARDANNAVVKRVSLANAGTDSTGAVTSPDTGNLADGDHRVIAYRKTVNHGYDPDNSYASITANVAAPLSTLATTYVKDSSTKRVAELGIAQALDLTAGSYAPKDPKVHNTSTSSDAFVAIRVAFQANNSSLNTKTVKTSTGTASVVNGTVAAQILTGLGFTKEASAQATAGFDINGTDWVADSGNGSYDGVYYFYYRNALGKSAASSTASATSALFQGLYIPSAAGRGEWTSGGTVSLANYLDFLMDQNGLNGQVQVVVDAAGVQTANLGELEDSYNTANGISTTGGKVTGTAAAPVETALRGIFG